MSDNTRDWLLKKLLKADRVIVEQRTEMENLRAEMETRDNAHRNRVDTLSHIRHELEDANRALVERIHQMAPAKQFKVVFSGPSEGKYLPLKVTSVSSTNGETTIHVERAV